MKISLRSVRLEVLGARVQDDNARDVLRAGQIRNFTIGLNF